MRPAVPIAEERDTAGVLRFRKFFLLTRRAVRLLPEDWVRRPCLSLVVSSRVSLFEDGRAKVLAGETSPEEMLRVLGPLEKK